jgi:hypothetical protein
MLYKPHGIAKEFAPRAELRTNTSRFSVISHSLTSQTWTNSFAKFPRIMILNPPLVVHCHLCISREASQWTPSSAYLSLSDLSLRIKIIADSRNQLSIVKHFLLYLSMRRDPSSQGNPPFFSTTKNSEEMSNFSMIIFYPRSGWKQQNSQWTKLGHRCRSYFETSRS